MHIHTHTHTCCYLFRFFRKNYLFGVWSTIDSTDSSCGQQDPDNYTITETVIQPQPVDCGLKSQTGKVKFRDISFCLKHTNTYITVYVNVK